MELSGSDAERWDQMSNKIQELEQQIASYHELVKGISSTLTELITNLAETQQTANSLSSLAYKEVLRQESGTINADDDYIATVPAETNIAPQLSRSESMEQLTSLASKPVAQSQPKNESVPASASKRRKRETKAKTPTARQVGLSDDSGKE